MKLGSHKAVESIALTDKYILSASEDELILWDRDKRAYTNFEKSGLCVSWHPTENKFALAEGDIVCMYTLEFEEEALLAYAKTFHQNNFIFAHDRGVNTVKVSEEMLVSGGNDGFVRVWENYEEFHWQHPGIVVSVDIHNDLVASCSLGTLGNVQLWKILDDKRKTCMWTLDTPATCLSFSENGKLLLVGCENRFILLETDTKAVIYERRCGEVHSIGFLDNEHYFVGVHTLQLWNINGCHITLDKNDIRCASCYEDKVVFSTSEDVYLWDVGLALEWLESWSQMYAEIVSLNKLELSITQPMNGFKREEMTALKEKAALLGFKVSRQFDVWLALLSPSCNDMSLGQRLRF